jgi:uncharacterized protein (DUF302 family)
MANPGEGWENAVGRWQGSITVDKRPSAAQRAPGFVPFGTPAPTPSEALEMNTAPAYGLKKTLAIPFEEADVRVREELKREGFGVLTEIDVKSTMKAKLDKDFRPYKILGACNPPLAHQALSEEIDIGLLLPCNVVVYEGPAAGSSVVAILDPEKQLAVSGRDDIRPLAREVLARMERVLAAL